jgi:hypothetical protein
VKATDHPPRIVISFATLYSHLLSLLFGDHCLRSYELAVTEYCDSSHRLEPVLDRLTMSALRGILESEPWKDLDDINYAIPARGTGYSMSLRNVYVLANTKIESVP